MPSLTVSVSHQLSEQEAAQRLKERYEAAKKVYGGHVSDFEEQWNDRGLHCRFRAYGMKFAGQVESHPGEVQVRLDLPLLAMAFKGKIEQAVRQELGAALS